MANPMGEAFLREVRSIIEGCSDLATPARAARVTAFAILVMLDGSGEHIGPEFRVVDEDGKLVEFWHHDL
jgi:hypothetical protein